MRRDPATMLSGLRSGSIIFDTGMHGAAFANAPSPGLEWHTTGQAAAGHPLASLASWAVHWFGRASRTGRRQPGPDYRYRVGSTR